MKGALRLIVAVLGLLVVAFCIYAFSRQQSYTARAAHAVLTLDFVSADSLYRVLERRMPNIFGLRDNAVMRRKELLYRSGNYQAILIDRAFEDKGLHPRMHAVFGHTLYRSIATKKDRAAVLAVLDEAISHYQAAGVVDPLSIDHAYNYEFLLRVQKRVVDKKQKLPLEGRDKTKDKDKSKKGQGQKDTQGQKDQQQQEGRSAQSIYGVEGKPSSGDMPRVRMKIYTPQIDEGQGRSGLDKGPGIGKGTVRKKPG